MEPVHSHCACHGDHIVDAYVLGRTSRELAMLLKASELLAAFGLVKLDPSDNARLEELQDLLGTSPRKTSILQLSTLLAGASRKGVAGSLVFNLDPLHCD